MNEQFIPRELKGKRLIGYCLGDFGVFLSNMLEGTFVFQFYVYTINLNSILVSIGVTSQLIIGSFLAIIFGVIIDNKKPGRFGKRRLFLLYALPLWFIMAILLWFPPWKCPIDNSFFMPTAIFFWTVSILKSISRSLFYTVYLSMLPEQSQTLENQEKVASIRSALMIIASVLSLLLPLIVQSLLEDPANVKWWQPSGMVILFYIPLTATILAVFGMISVILTFLSVDESFHNSEKIQPDKIKISLALKRMKIPLGDNNFIRYILALFFITTTGKILGLLVFPFQTFLLGFRSSEFYIYIFVSIFGKFGWYAFWRLASKRKKPVIRSLYQVIFVAMVASMLDILFLFQNLSFGVKTLMYIIIWSTVLGSYYSYALFSIPIGASIVQESAEDMEGSTGDFDKNISTISGSYYGLSYFVTWLGPAFASMFVGIFLTGSNEDNPIIITFLFFSMAIFYFISLLFIRKIKIKQNST